MTNGYTRSLLTSQGGWLRWLLPAASDLIFVAFFGLLTLTSLSTRLLGDAGIGWHIRTGQIILTRHAVPRVDPFSATMSGHPWFAWEWLYDLKVGWLDRAAGLNAVVLYTAILIAAVFACTFYWLLKRGTNIALALILMLLAASAAMIHFQARPHVNSWLFTLLWFWILESSERNPRRLWLLPVLMLLWVNFHGGFLLGLALLAIYWLATAWQCVKPRNGHFESALQTIRAGQRLRTLTAAGVLSALATLANPYGYALHIHIYHYLSNRFLMDHIDEFQSPNFHYVAQKCFAVLLLLTLVAAATRGRKASASHGLVILFAIYSGLYASRNIPVSSLLLILIIGPWLSNVIDQYSNLRPVGVQPLENSVSGFLGRMREIELGMRGHLWPLTAVIVAIWIVAQGGDLGTAKFMDAHFDANRFPVDAASYIENHGIEGPLVAPDSWGGYLIYRLYPGERVVVDDRHDFYGEAFLKSYLKMIHVEPGWEEFLEQQKARMVLMPKDSALANILRESPGWKLIYNDDVAVIFSRGRGQRSGARGSIERSGDVPLFARSRSHPTIDASIPDP